MKRLTFIRELEATCKKLEEKGYQSITSGLRESLLEDWETDPIEAENMLNYWIQEEKNMIPAFDSMAA